VRGTSADFTSVLLFSVLLFAAALPMASLKHTTPGSFQRKRPTPSTDTPIGSNKFGGSSGAPSTTGKDDDGKSEPTSVLNKKKRSRAFKETDLVSGKGLVAILNDFPKLPFKGLGHEVNHVYRHRAFGCHVPIPQ
jgi:hypothetical protein